MKTTFFADPPPPGKKKTIKIKKRTIHQTVTIICSCVLKEIPNKSIIFLVPPTPLNRRMSQNVNIFYRTYCLFAQLKYEN